MIAQKVHESSICRVQSSCPLLLDCRRAKAEISREVIQFPRKPQRSEGTVLPKEYAGCNSYFEVLLSPVAG